MKSPVTIQNWTILCFPSDSTINHQNVDGFAPMFQKLKKNLPPNHEELPLGSLSSMRNWEFTLQPLSKLKWVVISSTKVILTRFSCLEWSSFYTWDSAPFIPLSASAKTNGAEGFMGVIGYQDWRSGGGCPGGTGKLLPNI